MKLENQSITSSQMLAGTATTTPPLDANMSLSTKAKRRMRTSKEETAVLEDYYSKNPNPNQEQKQEIANVVQMGVRNVHFWFQNRRAKENKKRKMIQSRQQKQEALAVTQQQPNQQQTQTQQSAAATTHLSPNYQQLESIYQYQMMTNTPFGILEPNINRIHSQEQQHGQPSNNNNKKNKGKGKAVAVDNTTKFNLPPISSIMVPNFRNLSIPFYFHHSKFGIEDCMLQWSTTMNSTSSAAAGVDHYSSLNSPITYGAAAAATLVGGSNY